MLESAQLVVGSDADADRSERDAAEAPARLRRRHHGSNGHAPGGPPAGSGGSNGHVGEDELKSSNGHDLAGPGSNEQIAERSRRVREIWSESERRWKPLTNCMFKCGFFGTQNLLEACGYWCLGTLYGQYSAAWAYWAVQIVFVTLNWSMMMFLLTSRPLMFLPGG
ncbi:unnamed protein product, partial [Prorocentrum cordatum]